MLTEYSFSQLSCSVCLFVVRVCALVVCVCSLIFEVCSSLCLFVRLPTQLPAYLHTSGSPGCRTLSAAMWAEPACSVLFPLIWPWACDDVLEKHGATVCLPHPRHCPHVCTDIVLPLWNVSRGLVCKSVCGLEIWIVSINLKPNNKNALFQGPCLKWTRPLNGLQRCTASKQAQTEPCQGAADYFIFFMYSFSVAHCSCVKIMYYFTFILFVVISTSSGIKVSFSDTTFSLFFPY